MVLRRYKCLTNLAKAVVLLGMVCSLNGCNTPSTPTSTEPRASGTPASGSTATAVYDRVIKSQTIRAAYLDYPPACMKDTKTGKLSGIFVDALEKAASNLGYKVQWTEEVGWGAQIEGLNADRYDIVGSPVWANPKRGTLTTLSKPLYYSGIGIYVRQGDNRFTNNWAGINSPSVRIGTVDGETGDLIAKTSFPKAQRASSPQTTEISQKLLDLASNKCDVVFAEPYFGYKFLQSNPNKIQNIAAEHPISVLGNCYMFKANEFQMKQMIDVAMEDLENSGYIDQLLDKYEPKRGTYYRLALPYRLMK